MRLEGEREGRAGYKPGIGLKNGLSKINIIQFRGH